jgi:hypothetical protein
MIDLSPWTVIVMAVVLCLLYVAVAYMTHDISKGMSSAISTD